MSSTHGALELATVGPGFYEVTHRLARWLQDNDTGDALLTVMVRHTSASLLIQENADPDVQKDLLAFLDRFAPAANHPDMRYLVHRLEGPDDMPAHIKAAVLPTTLSIPVRKGVMRLGKWQGVYLVEHRTDPHRREIALHLLQ